TQKLSFNTPKVVGGSLPARIGRCHAIVKGYVSFDTVHILFLYVMTEQDEIITPVFKNKASDFKKQVFTARPAVKINVNEVELTIF
ncbi:hypothetical protein QP705_09895, partial [Limosilactobacillus reuteri]|uniref:hypothetical protein n=1 Tax=Limosilactobacillus reuteri TaxID=1598 RepID=UPI00254E6250